MYILISFNAFVTTFFILVASPGPSSRVSLASFDKIKDESDDEFFDAQGRNVSQCFSYAQNGFLDVTRTWQVVKRNVNYVFKVSTCCCVPRDLSIVPIHLHISLYYTFIKGLWL